MYQDLTRVDIRLWTGGLTEALLRSTAGQMTSQTVQIHCSANPLFRLSWVGVCFSPLLLGETS